MTYDPFASSDEGEKETYDPFASAPAADAYDPFASAPAAPAASVYDPFEDAPAAPDAPYDPLAAEPAAPAAPAAAEAPPVSEDRWVEIIDPKVRKILDEDYEAKKGSSMLPLSGPSNLLGSAISGAIGAVKGLWDDSGSPVEGAKKAWKAAQEEYPVEEVYDKASGKVNMTKLGRSKFDQYIRNTLAIEDLNDQLGIPIDYLKKYMYERGIATTDATAAQRAILGGIQTAYATLGNLQPYLQQKIAGAFQSDQAIPGDYLGEAEEPYRQAVELAKVSGKSTKIRSAHGAAEIEVTPQDTVYSLQKKSFDAEMDWAKEVLRGSTESGAVSWGGMAGGATRVVSPIATGLSKAMANEAFKKALPGFVAKVAANPRLANVAVNAMEGAIFNEPVGRTPGEVAENTVTSAIAGGVFGALGKLEAEKVKVKEKPPVPRAPEAPRAPGIAPRAPEAPPAPEVPSVHEEMAPGAMDPRALVEAHFQLRDEDSPVSRKVEKHVAESTAGMFNPEGLRNIKVFSDKFDEAPSSEGRVASIPVEHVSALNDPTRATGSSAKFAAMVNKFGTVINDTTKLIEAMEERGMGGMVNSFQEGVAKMPVYSMREVLFQNMLRGVNAGQESLERLGMADPRAASTVNLAEKTTQQSIESYRLDREKVINRVSDNKKKAEVQLHGIAELLRGVGNPSAGRILRILSSALTSVQTPNVAAISRHISELRGVVSDEVYANLRKGAGNFASSMRKAEGAFNLLPQMETHRNISDPTAAVALGSRARTLGERVVDQISKGGGKATRDHLLPVIEALTGDRQRGVADLYERAAASIQAGRRVGDDVVQGLKAHADEAQKAIGSLAAAYDGLRKSLALGNADDIARWGAELQGIADELPEGGRLAAVLADSSSTERDVASAVADLRRNLGYGTTQLQKTFIQGVESYNHAVNSVEGLTARVAKMGLGDVAGIIIQLNNASLTFQTSSHLLKLQELQGIASSKYMESVKDMGLDPVVKMQMFEIISGDVIAKLRLYADPDLLLKSPDHITNMVEMNNFIAKDVVDSLSDTLSARIGRPVSKEFLLGYYLRPETLEVDLKMLIDIGMNGDSLKEQVKFWERRRDPKGTFYGAGNIETAERFMTHQTMQVPVESFASSEADFRKQTRSISAFIAKHFPKDVVKKLRDVWSDPDVVKGGQLWDGAGIHLDFYDKYVLDPKDPGKDAYHLEPLGIVHKAMFLDSDLGRNLAAQGQKEFVAEASARLQKAFGAVGDVKKAGDGAIIDKYAQHLYAKWAGMADVPKGVWRSVYEQRLFTLKTKAALHRSHEDIIKEQNVNYGTKLGMNLPTRKWREHYVNNTRKLNPNSKTDMAHGIYVEQGMSGLWKSSDEAQLAKAAEFDGVKSIPATPADSLVRSIENLIRDSYMGHTRAYQEDFGFQRGREGWDAEHTYINDLTRGGDIDSGGNWASMAIDKIREDPIGKTTADVVTGIADVATPIRRIQLRLSSPFSMFMNLFQQYNTAFPMLWQDKKLRADEGMGRFLGGPMTFGLNAALSVPVYVAEGVKFTVSTLRNLYGQEKTHPGMRGVIAEEARTFAEMTGRLQAERVRKFAGEVEEVGKLSKGGKVLSEASKGGEALSAIADSYTDKVSRNLKERGEVAMAITSMNYGEKVYKQTVRILEEKGVTAAYEHLLPLMPFRNQGQVWSMVRSMEDAVKNGGQHADFRSFIREYTADSVTRFGKMSLPHMIHRVSKVSPNWTTFLASKTNMGYRHMVYPIVRGAQKFREMGITPKEFSNGTNAAIYSAWTTQMAISAGYQTLKYGLPMGAAGIIMSLRESEREEENSRVLRTAAGALGNIFEYGVGGTTGFDITRMDPGVIPFFEDPFTDRAGKSAIGNMIVGWEGTWKAIKKADAIAGEFGLPNFSKTELENKEMEIATILADPAIRTPEKVAADQKRITELMAEKNAIHEANDNLKWLHLGDWLTMNTIFVGWMQTTVLEPVTFAYHLAMGQLDDLVNNNALKKSPLGKVPEYQDRPVQSFAQAFGLPGVPGEVGYTPDFAAIGRDLEGKFGISGESWAMMASKTYAAMLKMDDIYNGLVKAEVVAPVGKPQKDAVEKRKLEDIKKFLPKP